MENGRKEITCSFYPSQPPSKITLRQNFPPAKAKVNKCSLVLKRLQGNCPSYMYDLLKCNADLHTRRGRYSALNFVCPRYNRESERGKTFSVSATRLWNSLPINLKIGTCVTSFRKAIYSHFLTRYNDVDHFSLSET